MDWQRIRNEYVTEPVTYRELAEKYGLSPRTVRDHGAREKWTEARRQHRKRVSALAEEKAADKIADAEAEISAIRANTRVLIYKELQKRMNEAAALDGADFRRLVQNYIDMVEAEDSLPTGEANELLKSIAEAVSNPPQPEITYTTYSEWLEQGKP